MASSFAHVFYCFFFLALFHCAGPADVQGNKPMLLFLFGSAFAQVETTKF